MFDTAKNKLKILQLPRDVFVGDKVDTGGEGKINNLYFHSADPNNRMAALARVLKDQLRLPVDMYVTIDMDALKEIIDIKGSIEVYVPLDVNDPRFPGAEIKQGWRHFDGEQAEFFLRNRYSTTYRQQGDIMRLQMQQSFYSALFREFKTLEPWDLVMWMKVLLYRCETDMDPLEIGRLAQKALKLQASDILFVRPPVSGARHNGRILLSLMPEETAALLNQYFRPEGQSFSPDQLNIYTLPVDEEIGEVEASIRSMSDVQRSEPEKPGSQSQEPAA